MFAQTRDNRRIVLGARECLALDYMRIKPALFSCLKAGSIRLVGDHDRDLGAGNFSSRDVIGNRDKVGTASGEEDAESFHQKDFLRRRRGGTEEGRNNACAPEVTSNRTVIKAPTLNN